MKSFTTDVTVKIIKAKVPILFLDSFCIIDYIRMRKGRVGNTTIERLFDLLGILAKDYAIQCPVAEQELEIGYATGKKNNIDFLNFLGNGNQFQNTLIIEEVERNALFHAWKDMKKEIELNYPLGFSSIDNNQHTTKITFKGLALLADEKIIEKLQEEKRERTEALNGLIKSREKNSFEKQFIAESQAEFRLNAHYPFEFSESSYWIEVPYCYIQSAILSYILNFCPSFQAGDYIDIINASRYLPFCNFYLTDKRMADILVQLGIDKKYNTEIYSVSNVEILIQKLEKIAKIS